MPDEKGDYVPSLLPLMICIGGTTIVIGEHRALLLLLLLLLLLTIVIGEHLAQ